MKLNSNNRLIVNIGVEKYCCILELCVLAAYQWVYNIYMVVLALKQYSRKII